MYNCSRLDMQFVIAIANWRTWPAAAAAAAAEVARLPADVAAAAAEVADAVPVGSMMVSCSRFLDKNLAGWQQGDMVVEPIDGCQSFHFTHV